MMKKSLIFLSLTILLFAGCGEDDEFEPEIATIINCNTFEFKDKTFELPEDRCGAGLTLEYDIKEDGDSFKFNIICNGTCVETVETRE